MSLIAERTTGVFLLRGGAARMSGNRVEWDTDNPDSLIEAERVWQESARNGLLFHDNTGGRANLPREQVQAGFNPATAPRETAITAPMAGG
jgi:hypothetical protein